MPDINEIIEAFRRDLELRDRIVLHLIASRYHDTAARILQDLKPLQTAIQEAQAAGAEVNRSWLIRERRLTSLYAQVRVEMGRFTEAATGLTAAEKIEQAQVGSAHALRLIKAQVPSGVEVAFNRLSTRAVENIIAATSQGPLRELFDDLGEATSKRVREELIHGVALGQGPQKTARRISQFLTGNLVRAETIARTETIRAYRESGRQTAIENADVLEGWTWVSALVGSCAACIALHGTKHPVEERMQAHPNCRCVQRWDTKSWQELGREGIPETGPQPVDPGAAWFARQPEGMQIEVLGKAGFHAYKSGRVKLEHFIGKAESPQWGKSLFQQSLKAALSRARSEGHGDVAGELARSATRIGPRLKIVQPEKGRHLARVLGLIDELHGDGPLHDLPVRFDRDPINRGAFHRSNPPHATATRITVSERFGDTSGQEFTFAHEVGHYLDLQGMRSSQGWFGSETKDFSPSMTRLFDLLLGSPEVKSIKAWKRKTNHREYLLRRREIWARAYSQYLATKTADPGLLAGLEEWRTAGGINQFAHWTDESFEPIMKAIDKLFLELGWLTKP